MVKNLPAVQRTLVQLLGWEDPLGKEMVIHFSILIWGIPWTEEPSGLQFMGPQKSWMRLSDSTIMTHILFSLQPGMVIITGLLRGH